MPLTSHRNGSVLLEGEGIVGETVISDRLRVDPGRGVDTWREQCLTRLGSAAASLDAMVSVLREIVIDRAQATNESPISLQKIKIIALMVLWSQEAEIDHLVLEELLTEDHGRLSH